MKNQSHVSVANSRTHAWAVVGKDGEAPKSLAWRNNRYVGRWLKLNISFREWFYSNTVTNKETECHNSTVEVYMVPSKPQDFPGTHGGFEGEEETILHLKSGATIKIVDDGGDFIVSHPASTGRGLNWPFHSLERIGLEPLPFPYSDAK